MQTLSSLPESNAPDSDEARSSVVLPQEVMLSDAIEIRQHIVSSLAGDGPVRFDFSSVTSMDVAGLQLVLSAMQTALQSGRTISVVDSTDAIWARTLSLAGADPAEWGSR